MVSGDLASVNIDHNITITNAGRLENAVRFFGIGLTDTFKITNSGELLSSGSAIFVNTFGSGKHSITNSATGIINAGSDAINATAAGAAITITNAGTIIGDIKLGSGNDKLTNTGLIDGDIDMGGGNDTLTFSKSQFAIIEMRAGNDTLTGGAFNDAVSDNLGADKYLFGGGDDQFVATGFNDGLTDTIDGGTNNAVNFDIGFVGDVYIASAATGGGVSVNLDSVIKTDLFASQLAAKTATGTNIGTDKISNIESVVGTNFADVIFGSSLANYIDGGAGAFDELHGGAGNDYVVGGAGSDRLWGDAGRDILVGGTQGTPADGAIDRFVFAKLTDSTAALKGRDIIYGFENGIDDIDFSGLGVLAATTFVFTDTAFTPTLGQSEIRALTTEQGWLLQLDKNGDGKVDLAIDIVDATHAITWDAADFILL